MLAEVQGLGRVYCITKILAELQGLGEGITIWRSRNRSIVRDLLGRAPGARRRFWRCNHYGSEIFAELQDLGQGFEWAKEQKLCEQSYEQALFSPDICSLMSDGLSISFVKFNLAAQILKKHPTLKTISNVKSKILVTKFLKNFQNLAAQILKKIQNLKHFQMTNPTYWPLSLGKFPKT